MSQKSRIVVALHGAGMHAGVWGSLAGALDLPCQPLSLPGHGEASREALLPSIEKMAEWLKTRLAEYPPQSVTLAGHSMGALVALEAAQHPAVSSLVLLGAAARMPVNPDLLKQAAENPDAAADMILKWGVSALHPEADVLRSLLKEQMKAVAAGALLNDLNACHAYQHGAAAAKAIRLPALVISGADDKLTRATEGKILSDIMPQAEFYAMPECGHMMPVEKPVETAEEISSFAEQLGD